MVGVRPSSQPTTRSSYVVPPSCSAKESSNQMRTSSMGEARPGTVSTAAGRMKASLVSKQWPTRRARTTQGWTTMVWRVSLRMEAWGVTSSRSGAVAERAVFELCGAAEPESDAGRASPPSHRRSLAL